MKKDFLHIDDWSENEIRSALALAQEVKAKLKRRENYQPFQDHSLAMIFSKPSARTRVSFETGFFRMGGHAIYLGPTEVDIGRREPAKDLARVISGYNDMIVARLFDHPHVLELAKYASVPVINGLTDYNHPCQVMADILTLKERFGSLKDLKVAYIGDGNNVVHSWLHLARRLPMHFITACPDGYDPDPDVVEQSRNADISTIEVVRDPRQAVKEADVIYTDVWASMGQKHELEERKRRFKGFTVSTDLMSLAKPTVVFMHCLPAQRGLEVTDEVIESEASIVFDQAENRMHAQNAIMLNLAKRSG